VHNSFSYHLTPAGTMVETGAHALGCAVIPAGTAPTEAQVTAAAQFRATAYGGTPSFLKVLLDRAVEMGLDLSSLTKASVTAEALPATLRKSLKERGVQGLQWYGTAGAGLVADETAGRRTRGSSPTRPRGWRAWWWTRTSFWKLSGRGPAIRFRPGKWARWW